MQARSCGKISMSTSPVWLFDLDNTLHHADAGIFQLINRHMTDYMAKKLHLSQEKASNLRQDYWHRYGATLAGLQLHHPEIDIHDFLLQSHPLEPILAALQPMEQVSETLPNLHGRKAIFSNAPSFYVEALASAMQLDTYFDALLGTDNFGLYYKPADQAYLTVCRLLQTQPADCIMIDDSADNLHAAQRLGMRTVWFGQQSHDLPFVDFAAKDFAALQHWARENGLTCKDSVYS